MKKRSRSNRMRRRAFVATAVMPPAIPTVGAIKSRPAIRGCVNFSRSSAGTIRRRFFKAPGISTTVGC